MLTRRANRDNINTTPRKISMPPPSHERGTQVAPPDLPLPPSPSPRRPLPAERQLPPSPLPIVSPTASEVDFAARTAMERPGTERSLSSGSLPSYSGEASTGLTPAEAVKQKAGFGLPKDLFGISQRASMVSSAPTMPPKDAIRSPRPTQPAMSKDLFSPVPSPRPVQTRELFSPVPSPRPAQTREFFSPVPSPRLGHSRELSSPTPSSPRYELQEPPTWRSPRRRGAWSDVEVRSTKSDGAVDCRPLGRTVARDLRRLLTVIEGKDKATVSRSEHMQADLAGLKHELERISSKLKSAPMEGDDASVVGSINSEDQPNLADKSECEWLFFLFETWLMSFVTIVDYMLSITQVECLFLLMGVVANYILADLA
jgi:hypothetical protein